MSRARLACVFAGAVALMTTTRVAHADDPVAAEALFKEGRALLDKGRIEEACDLFTRSEQLDQAVGTLINVGECFEHKKQYASAWGAFREAVNLAVRRNDARVTLAREKAARVEPRVAKLTLLVDPIPAGGSVTRNGVSVDAAALNTAIPIDPGRHTVVVSAPNRKPWRGTVDLREGEAAALRVPKLEVLSTAAENSPSAPLVASPPSPRTDERTGTSTQSKVALGLEIGGGVVLVTGLVFGALAISAWSSVEQTCPNARCPTAADRARLDGDQSRASSFATVSTLMTAVGGAALATGIVLHLTAPSRSFSVAPAVDRTACGFLATLRL